MWSKKLYLKLGRDWATRVRYRVYCKNKQQYEKDDVFLTPDGRLFQEDVNSNMQSLDLKTHIIEKCVDRTDENGKLIFEGDKIRLEITDEDSCCGKTYFEEYYIKWDTRQKVFQLHDGNNYVLGDPKGKYRPNITYITDTFACLIESIEIIGNIHNKDLEI